MKDLLILHETTHFLTTCLNLVTCSMILLCVYVIKMLRTIKFALIIIIIICWYIFLLDSRSQFTNTCLKHEQRLFNIINLKARCKTSKTYKITSTMQCNGISFIKTLTDGRIWLMCPYKNYIHIYCLKPTLHCALF